MDGLRIRNLVTRRALVRLRTPLQTSTAMGTQRRGVLAGTTTSDTPTRSIALVYHAGASAGCRLPSGARTSRDVRRRMIMKREYDFAFTWTTIPRVRDATAQVGDGGALVRVHAGRRLRERIDEGVWPGRLRPPHPPGPSRWCIALVQAQDGGRL